MVAALFIGNTGQVKIEEAICFLLNELAAPVMKAACITCADGIAEGRQGLFVQGSCFPGMLYRIVPFCGGSASYPHEPNHSLSPETGLGMRYISFCLPCM